MKEEKTKEVKELPKKKAKLPKDLSVSVVYSFEIILYFLFS